MWEFLRMIRLGNTNQMLDIKFQQYCAYRYYCHQHLAWQLQRRLVCNLCWHDPPGNATPVRETSRAHCSIRPARYCIDHHLGCHGLECGHLEGEKTHRGAFQGKNRPRPSIQAHGHGWRQDAPDTWAHATGRFCNKIKQNVTLKTTLFSIFWLSQFGLSKSVWFTTSKWKVVLIQMLRMTRSTLFSWSTPWLAPGTSLVSAFQQHSLLGNQAEGGTLRNGWKV